MYRLGKSAVAGRIPGREPDPLLSGRVERNPEAVIAEWLRVGRRDHLPLGLVAVAPDQLDELQGESPFDVRVERAARTASFDAEISEQDLPARDPEITGPHRL